MRRKEKIKSFRTSKKTSRIKVEYKDWIGCV